MLFSAVLRRSLAASFLLPTLLTAACGQATLPSAAPTVWYPFVLPWDDAVRGTATDAAGLNGREAGIQGRIVSREGRFVEEKTGRRVRFLATNVGGKAAFPSRADADKIAARMAKLGINLVRFHHLNNGWDLDGGTVWKRGRTFVEIDPAQLDKLDYFLAALKRNGIYWNINLQTAREYVPELGFPESVRQLKNFAKKVDKFDERMIELQKQYAKDLLDRVNPYTKLRYRDDPALMKIEINNENSLVGWPGESPGAGLSGLPEPFRGNLVKLWNDWLRRTYPSQDALAKAWPNVEDLKGPSVVSRNSTWSNENQSNGDVEFKVVPGTGSESAAPTMIARVTQNPGPNWHVQAHLGGLDLKNGETYTLSFRTRADRETSFGVDSRLSKPDWRFLGLGGTATASPQWKTYRFVFRVVGSEPNSARIGFVLGESRGTIEIADLKLQPGVITEGLQPGERLGNIDLPPVSLSPKFRDYTRFLVETETAYSERMRNFLREQLGFKGTNIIDTQISWGSLTALTRERAMEFADNHAYWNHPTFLGSDWDPKNYRVDRRALVNEMGGRQGTLGDLAMHRVLGWPYSVSEYNHPAPSDYQAEMMPLYALFAAFQDWDCIYTFAWDATGEGVRNDMYENYFDMSRNPNKNAFFASAARIFREGLLAPPSASVVLEVPKERAWEHAFNVGEAWQTLEATPKPLSELVSVRKADVAKPTLRRSGATAATPWRVLDGNGGKMVAVDAEKVKAATGFVGGRTVEFKDAKLTFGTFGYNFAGATLVPTDNKPITQSERLLLTVVSRVENQNMGWNAERNSVSDNWGSGPTQAEAVPLTVEIRTASTVVYALDGTGKRVRRVPSVRQGDRLRFQIGADTKSLLYEVAAR